MDYVRADDVRSAAAAVAAVPGARFIGGGTTLLDLMKCGVEDPAMIVDISRLAELQGTNVTAHRLSIGAADTMSRVAADEAVSRSCPAITTSLRQAASPQLRNMATIGGNLMQRTRCVYFRDPRAFPSCNKRRPGSGCSAFRGVNRGHALLGGSPDCIATYPGDLAVALTAFDAEVIVTGETPRKIPIAKLFQQPDKTPAVEHCLRPGELIVGVELSIGQVTRRSTYLKVRDRQSYEFASASAAVGVAFEADGCTINAARVALGGVATVPWRAKGVEQALVGSPFTESVIRAASRFAVEGAIPQRDNGYKIELVPRVVARALLSLEHLQ